MPTPAERVLQRAVIGGVLMASLVAAWGSRYNLNPDGVSYVDMARYAVAGAPGQLINGYWSPGYPVLLLPFLALFRGDWSVLIPALHLVNLLLFMVGLAIALRLARLLDDGVADSCWMQTLVPCVYAVIVLQGIGMGLLTPDFAVVVAILAAAWCCVQWPRSHSPRLAIALGLVLGAGYWVKGILFPVNLILLAVMLAASRRDRDGQRRVLLSALVFGLVALPLIVLVSRRVAHASIGEVGKLNYAWEVDGVTPFVGWLGDATTPNGIPLHPPRVIDSTANALGFATPIRGSYPLWYEPSFWYAGVRARFVLSGQWAALQRSASTIIAIALDYWAVLFAGVVLTFAARLAPALPRRDAATSFRPEPVLLAWSGFAVFTYALVHVESRYLAGFVLVPALIGVARLARRSPGMSRWTIAATFAALACSLVRSIAANTGGYQPGYRPEYFAVADTLHATGLSPGAAVAVVGDGFEQYGVVVAGAHIVAQVMDSSRYWTLSPGARDSVDLRLASAGAVALLANNVADSLHRSGWHLVPIGDSGNVGIRRLARPGQVAQRLGAQ